MHLNQVETSEAFERKIIILLLTFDTNIKINTDECLVQISPSFLLFSLMAEILTFKGVEDHFKKLWKPAHALCKNM